ncbi:MAG: hypothetical protein ACKV22_08955 [Bryobacteraceae bacterium]
MTASSSVEGAPPDCILDGEIRDIPKGPIHRWSAKLEPDGAWIQLSWDQPQAVRAIQLTFDTGFQRELTLTAQNSYNQIMIRGPQPETVRDYDVLARHGPEGEWTTLVEKRGNYQRVNRLAITSGEMTQLRLVVKATHGDPLARVFEIRCYA